LIAYKGKITHTKQTKTIRGWSRRYDFQSTFESKRN